MTSIKAHRTRRGVALAVCALGLFGAHAAGAQADPAFAPPARFSAISDGGVGAMTNDLAVADLNGDGNPDLLVTTCETDCGSPTSGFVSELLNQGNGKFQLQATFTPPDGARRLAVGDLNGDGNPDLVVGGGDRFDVYRGGPHGTLRLSQQIGTPAGSFPDFAIFDVNGDGRPDVIDTLRSQNSMEVRLTDATGAVGDPQTFAVGDAPVAVTLLTTSGVLEGVAVANSGSGNVSVYSASAAGLGTRRDWPAGPEPVAITSGAFVEGSPFPSLAVALSGGGVALLASASPTSPNAAFAAPRILPGDSSTGLSVASIDANASATNPSPMLVTDQSSGSHAVWTEATMPTPGTRFAGPPQVPSDTGVGIPNAGSSIADLNGDGAPDYVSTDTSAGSVDVYFAVPSVTVHGVDFDDQTVGSRSSQQQVVVINQGFAPLRVASVSLGGANPSDFAIADDRCSGEAVSFALSCSIAVRFAPSAAGARSATLTLTDNTTDHSQTVSLSGMGTTPAAPVQGPQGPQGVPGRDGRDGQPGPAGAQGPAAPAPSSATFVCTPGKGGKITCQITYEHGPTGAVTARLARNGRTFATGRGRIKHGALSLKMRSHRRLRKGRYQLKLSLPHHRTMVETVTVS